MNRSKRWSTVVAVVMMLGTLHARGQIDYGLVANIHLQISDAVGHIIVEGGPWAYDPYSQFLLPGVPAGSDRTVSVWTTDLSGLPTYTGRMEHVEIIMEDPFSQSATIAVIPEADRLGLYYDVFGTELTGVILESSTEPSVIDVEIDIKPGAEKNAWSSKSKGLLHVAVIGSETLDVTLIDPTSVTLAGIAVTKHWLEDVASAQPGLEADGVMDLVIAFDAAAVRATLASPAKGDVIPLTLEALLLDGTAITGTDTITIVGQETKVKRPRPGKKAKKEKKHGRRAHVR